MKHGWLIIALFVGLLGANGLQAEEEGEGSRNGQLQNQKWLERLDKDGDGVVTKEEFGALFRRLDPDGDGKIQLKKSAPDSGETKRPADRWKRGRKRAGGDARNLTNAKYVHEGELPPNVKYETCYSKLMNVDIGYAIYIPDEYKPDAAPFPVVYFFHGKTGNEIGASRNSKYLHRAIKEEAIRPSLAVYVNGLHTSFYVDSHDGKYMVESFFIKELIPHLEKKYNIVKSRAGRMLEGFSMGGHAAVRFGLKYPDMFCSVAVYGPALLPLKSFKMIQPEEFRILFNNDDELYKKSCSYDILDECTPSVLKHGVRFKLYGGTEDPSNRAATRFGAALKRNGIYSEYTRVEGVRHDMNKYLGALGTAGYKFHEQSMTAAGSAGDPSRDTTRKSSPAPRKKDKKKKAAGSQDKSDQARAGGLSPAGIYYCGTAGGLAPEKARYEDIAAVKLPFVNGISFRQFWRNLEPKEGKFDWTPLENAYRQTKAHGKWLQITVTGGMGAPDWVYEKGAASVGFNGKQVKWLGKDIALRMVVPWDEVYLKAWENFLQVLGERISHWDNVYCVHMTGGGFISEMHLPKKNGMIETWKKAGYSPERGVAMWKRIFAMYHKHMPQDVGLAIALSPILERGQVDDTVFLWAKEKYGNKVWFQRNILKERTARRPSGKYSAQLRTAARFTTVGWQTAIIPGKDLVGDKHVAYQHAINTNSSYVEVYPEEINDPKAKKELVRLNDGLKANYERLKAAYLPRTDR